jgi:hypothetical protein
MRPLGTSVAILLLGSAIHADWHFARPAHHRLSLDLSWHWLLAIPVFALVAYFVSSRRPARPLAASALVLGGGILLGAILEPAYEYWIGGAPRDWAWGPERTGAAIAFAAMGLLAYVATYLLVQRRWQAGSSAA